MPFAVSLRASRGTTRLTRPNSSAVAASIISPVRSISITLLRAMLRPTPTAGVVQKTPTFTPGNAKRAPSAATARSHIATSWQPAAVAMPCTRAITGCGNVVNDIINALHSANSCCCHARSGWARSSFRSWPAQNPLPSAPSTTQRRAGSAAMRSTSMRNAAIMSRESAL